MVMFGAELGGTGVRRVLAGRGTRHLLIAEQNGWL